MKKIFNNEAHLIIAHLTDAFIQKVLEEEKTY